MLYECLQAGPQPHDHWHADPLEPRPIIPILFLLSLILIPLRFVPPLPLRSLRPRPRTPRRPLHPLRPNPLHPIVLCTAFSPAMPANSSHRLLPIDPCAHSDMPHTLPRTHARMHPGRRPGSSVSLATSTVAMAGCSATYNDVDISVGRVVFHGVPWPYTALFAPWAVSCVGPMMHSMLTHCRGLIDKSDVVSQ